MMTLIQGGLIMLKKELAIGVFDSGLGGISVLKELSKHLPSEHYIYYGDSAYAPYGEKTKEEISDHCFEIMRFFVEQGVKAVVIACNTATSACVKELREAYPTLPIIGMEPALKVVAQGEKNQTIVVMATSFTLKEKKFNDLMARYEHDHTIIKLPSPMLVRIVENDQLDDEALVDQQLHEYLDPYLKNANSIVLGCTHFVFYKEKIEKLAGPHIRVVDGNEGTMNHVKTILEEKGELRTQGEGSVRIFNSAKDPYHIELSKKLLYQK